MPTALLRPALILLCALALAGCGGGGGGGDGTSSTAPGSGLASEPVLSGVVAVGAPLGGASITVIDSKGAALGSTTAHAVDGSYSLKLSSKTISGAVLVQARGLDASGAPQLLHSVVATPAVAMTANVTPLSDAVLHLALGTELAPVFAKAAEQQSVLARLSQLTAASDFLKTLLKTALTDVKITTTSSLDLLNASGFAANKSAPDLLLDVLRVGVTRSEQGQAQLMLANKLLLSGGDEVVVDLASAATELAKTSGAAPANAIVSTLKLTTSGSTLVASLPLVDDVTVALNRLIAQGSDAAALAADPLLAAFDTHNGMGKGEIAAQLAQLAGKNQQLGRWQINGCMDDTLKPATCQRVLVSAAVTDSSGKRVDSFAAALSYDSTAKKWLLKGNGRKLGFAVRPLAWRALDAAAAPDSAQTINPAQGIQVLLQGQTFAGEALLDKATVQTPGGFSLPLVYCGQRELCVAPTGGASVVAGASPLDSLLPTSTLGWIGGVDAAKGARYLGSFTLPSGATQQSAYLPATLSAAVPAASRFPVLDGVSSSAPLSKARMAEGLVAQWSGWAAANPDLRLLALKVVVRYETRTQQAEYPVPLDGSTTLTLGGAAPLQAFTPLAFELWLSAQDRAGRLLATRYKLPL